ncbi:hypothetical protein FRC11_002598, partial [Ceratobasidium sp. 423]
MFSEQPVAYHQHLPTYKPQIMLYIAGASFHHIISNTGRGYFKFQPPRKNDDCHVPSLQFLGDDDINFLKIYNGIMTSLFIQAPCSVTLDWEDASASLASALTNYLDLCLSLESKYLRVAMTSNLVDRIDSNLGNLHSLMEQQLSKSRSALARTRNRLASPLYRFPEEILSQIFMDVIHDYYPLMEGTAPIPMEDHLTYTYRGLHGLLRVCSVWRNVALRQAALWSTIPILNSAFGTPVSGCVLYRETSLSLQRAGGAGLHLAGVLGLSEYEKTKLLPDYVSRFQTINLKSQYLHSIHEIIDMVLGS